MVTQANAQSIAGDFIRACLAKGIPVSEAYMFGSYAKGTARPESDIDIALISATFGKNILENTKQTALINFTFSDIEIHHFNPGEFSTDDPFVKEIKRTGIKIF